jgi:hypothetical protein
MKVKFIQLLLLISARASLLGAQNVPSQAKDQLQTAWTANPELCLKALRLLVTNTAQSTATPKTHDEARAEALAALKAAGFPSGALLDEALKNQHFLDWLATVTAADAQNPDVQRVNPKKTPLEIEKNVQDLVDCIYGDGDGITKLGNLTRIKAKHPDSADLLPLLGLLDAVPVPSGEPNPTTANIVGTCHDSYANQLSTFRAAVVASLLYWLSAVRASPLCRAGARRIPHSSGLCLTTPVLSMGDRAS